MTEALEEVAEAAEHVARDQQQVARKARAMRRQREKGWSWRKILDEENGSGIVELLARSTGRLAAATRTFRQTVARGLLDEGATIRQIGKRFGVSHQRVSAMLNHSSARRADQT